MYMDVMTSVYSVCDINSTTHVCYHTCTEWNLSVNGSSYDSED